MIHLTSMAGVSVSSAFLQGLQGLPFPHPFPQESTTAESTACIAAWCRAAAAKQADWRGGWQGMVFLDIQQHNRHHAGTFSIFRCDLQCSVVWKSFTQAKFKKKKKELGKGNIMTKTLQLDDQSWSSKLGRWRVTVTSSEEQSREQKKRYVQNSVSVLGTMHKHHFPTLKHYPVVCVHWSPTQRSISVSGIWVVPDHSQWLTIYMQNVMNIWECFTPGMLYLAAPNESVLLAMLATLRKINGNFNYIL